MLVCCVKCYTKMPHGSDTGDCHEASTRLDRVSWHQNVFASIALEIFVPFTLRLFCQCDRLIASTALTCPTPSTSPSTTTSCASSHWRPTFQVAPIERACGFAHPVFIELRIVLLCCIMSDLIWSGWSRNYAPRLAQQVNAGSTTARSSKAFVFLLINCRIEYYSTHMSRDVVVVPCHVLSWDACVIWCHGVSLNVT